MANIIPMAGLGSRFSNEGYALPKPLIPVSGEPMILQVIKSLPSSDKWIFMVRQEHIDDFAIDSLIKSRIPEAIIIPIQKTTEGQASTCILAMPYLTQDEPVLIAACDNSFLYNKEKFESLANDPHIDAVYWTFTNHPSLSQKPEAWGWARLAADQSTIEDMSVKIPVSSTPQSDHAVVATFYFRRAGDFEAAYKAMVAENYRINGEFYVDSLPIFLKNLGKRSVIFDVDLYVGWGKPEDLYLYQEWEYKIRMNLGTDKPEFTLWKQFIQSL